MNSNETAPRKTILPGQIQDDVIEILGYSASTCLFLMALFAFIYTYFPAMAEDFTGLPEDFPLSSTFNGMLSFAAGSIGNIFTYIILAFVGSISFFAARYLENPHEKGIQLIEKEVSPTEVKSDAVNEEIAPASEEPEISEESAVEAPETETLPEMSESSVIPQEAPVPAVDENPAVESKPEPVQPDTPEIPASALKDETLSVASEKEEKAVLSATVGKKKVIREIKRND